MTDNDHLMTVSRNGQVSIPAQVRARWQTRQVIVVDLGDKIVVRPASEHPVASLQGKYRGKGPASDRVRQQERRQAREH
jgi:AbrB family looped-hinge helix DNA binding protein